MSVFKSFQGWIKSELEAMASAGELPGGLDLNRVVVEPPRDPSHGELSTNAAMMLAKPAQRQPRQIAERLVERLRRREGVTEASIGLMQEGRPGELPLSEAVLAARGLDCSLSYLTRATTERGHPPDAAVRFDHVAYVRRRNGAGLSAERVRSALQLSVRDARRLALGTYEPTIGQTMLLEQLVQLPPGGLSDRSN